MDTLGHSWTLWSFVISYICSEKKWEIIACLQDTFRISMQICLYFADVCRF